MATKITRVVEHEVRIKIAGLRPANPEFGSENDTYILDGVRPLEVDWVTVGLALEQAGVPKMDAEKYVEEFGELLFRKELAKALAERISYA